MNKKSGLRFTVYGLLLMACCLPFTATAQVTVGGDVYGGGNKASVARGTKVLIDQAGAVITGDVYGGGALAKVDTALVAVAPQTPVAATSIDSTLVTILQGTIGGNVYGGGLGDSVPAPYNGTANVAAHVYGAVHVSIGDTVRTAPGGIVGSATINGYVFGGNNNNGSPKDNVRVDIWSTARTAKQAATYTNNDREYALSQVFGGGNKAAYLPLVNTKKDTVYIHTCDNTIEYVYGGGNAADVGTSTINSATEVIIDGGRIEWVFGGGNGFSSTGNHDNASAANYNPGANIYGNATVTYHSGDISYIFGGSNQYGNITGSKSVNILADGSCPTKHIHELYGGSNEAPTMGDVALTMGCSSNTCDIDALFGGSRNADISGSVTLTIEGGSYTNVFGGNNIGGTINGDVTLNLLGGTIDSAFGGNNAGGAINGKITVNMLDLEDANCPLVVHNIYGGGKNAAYTPSTPGAYPEVNLIHGSVTKDGSGNGGNVYGGGFGATAIVTSTPTVNVGYGTSMASTATALNGSALTSSTVAVAGNVFGGGEAALVTGSTTVTLQADNPGTSASTSVGGHVFGGGNLANVSNSTDVNINGGTVDSNVYGGGNLADVLHSTDVDINGGTVTMDVYGGGALAHVGTNGSDHTNVTVTSGTVTGGVYGGGLGDDDHAALVNGAVQVTVDGGTVNDVFGCNNVNGRPTSTVRVDINNNVGGNVFGGGNLATYTGDPYVYINNGTVSGNVFGGGNGDPTDNTQVKGSVTGTPHVTVGDVGVGHESYQAIVSGDVYGGGNAAKVITGTPVVLVPAKCSNNTQITSVYGGGNAADVPATSVTIHGGIIDTVFGGGHGNKDATPTPIAANVDGNTNVSITGGTIGQVFGGSNSNGTIGGTINVNIDKGNTSCDMVISAVYGGGNYAASNVGNITIGCTGTSSSEYIDTVFGGANRANITGDITLTITGGHINNAFGGNNNSGTIDGDITVNVEWDNSGCSDKYLGNVYGAGNLAPYSQKTAGHPAVNIKNGTVAKVFGGGKGASAVVTGNPVVTIGDANASYVAIVGNVYGGGDAAAVTGNTTVTYNDANASSTVDSLFGGGNAAGVSGTATVTLTSGKVTAGLYGGCNTEGSVDGDITVALNGGTVGVNGTTTDVVYGGGFGHNTETGGDVTVTLGGTTVYGNLYGGSALGSVNGSSSNTTTVTIGGSGLNGKVFGGGMGSGSGSSTQATTIGDVIINYNTANSGLTGIYGGANVNGDVAGNIAVNIEANVGASGAGNSVDVFGGGYGQYTTTDGNVTVTVGNSTSPAIYGNLYGGSALGEVGATGKIAKVDFKAGTLYDTIFGGGMGNNSIAAAVSGGTNVTVTTGTISGGIYGGCNLNGTVDEDITVNANGGTIGANGAPASVFGGGFGNNTATSGDVTVNIGVDNGDGTVSGTATIWGDVYGGSGFGDVNNGSTDATTVNILSGAVKGNIYGGGLGATSPNYEAAVYGVVTVNIGIENGDGTYTGNATIGGIANRGNVYGCNNTNGSPKQGVTVNIFQTAHTTTDAANYTEDDGNGAPTYAIANVFGGGKNADYSPTSSTSTAVNVFGCANTIYRVFGGGDAAAVTGTEVDLQGGRFNYVFGGGNGEVTAANVGSRGIDIDIHGGTIGTLVSGSNTSGTITGSINVNVDNVGGCTEEVTDFFGGSNQVDIETDVITTIECGAGVFHNVYGGSNAANITGNVVLNVKGGTMENVFGGSKGLVGTPANIDGNVTLNLYGGTINQDAFGGSNINGNITGNITVNVLDHEGTCALDVNNIYGGGNLTPYTPTNANATSPTISVMHIKQAEGIRGNVYGGGKGATAIVTAQPRVNIGYNATTMNALATVEYPAGIDRNTQYVAKVTGSVFGGGDAAAVNGSPIVTLDKTNSQVGYLYGGGNEAGITGSTTVTMNNGRVTDGIYGGCNTSGDVTGNSTINLLGGQIGSSSNTAVVFGGGYGAATNIAGNVLVTMGNIGGTANPTIYADIYGGSALGNVNTGNVDNDTKVNSTNTTTLDILSGTLTGNIFGGGLGQREPSAIAPMVHGMVHINIGCNTGTNQSPEYTGYANLVDAKVYGCNNVNGSPQNDVHIDVYATAHPTNTLVDDTITRSYAIDAIYGGGNKADYAPENNNHSSAKKTYIRVYGCENTVDEIYGGGNAAAVVGDSVYIEGGRFNMIFGGGNGAVTAANVGLGGIHLNARSGRVGYIFEQCNKRGEVTPGAPIVYYQGGGDCNNGILRVDYHYCGGNIQDVYGDSLYIFTCTDNVRYLELYGGCRLGCHYGNITLEIQGGTIGDVYGGSMGQEGYSADVRKYPDTNDVKGHELDYPEGILTFLRDNPELQGTGGNVTLIIKGGTIGRVFGGCNTNGNVEGRITVIIDSAEINACPLDLDYVYGGGNEARYIPDTTHPYPYPLIQLKKGHVNHDVFGGGHGLATNVDAGRVESNPHIVMAPEDGKFWVKGNIYGGGEMGSVGKYTREESGKPTACVANTGHTTIEISAGKVGPAVLKMPDYKGHVFGGSKGAVGDTSTTTGNPKISHLAYVNTSDVTISGTAFIKGSVYGGGESGRVFDSTHVKIQGGQIGCGWNASTDTDLDRVYTAAEWAYDVTSDNTKFLYECSHWPFGDPSTHKYDPYDPYEHTSAHDGHTFYGNVFGGGSGMMPYQSRNVADNADSSIYIQTGGRVMGNTRVEVTGGHILTNLYGGCELGDVLDTCTVIFHGGTLGVPRTLAQIEAHPVTCYLFGAGKGDERVRFNTRTNVKEVRVTVDGGRIYGSVFGGGEDGHVMRDVLMEIKPNANIGTWGTSYVDGNVFGGGRGFSGIALTAGNVAGDITVNITGGTMLGSIYGGGRLASVGYGLYPATDTNYGVMRPDDKDDAGNTVAGFSRGHITVNISGNTVIGNDVASDYSLPHSRGGNVFGGSMGRLTKLDGTMVLPLWHRLGCAKATTVNIRDNVHVKGNVYGGSELGRVTDSITVNISGNVTVGRNAAGSYGHGNVYGGGMGHTLTAAERTEVGNDATSDSIPTFAGLTGGTIKVNISGGAINNNVYGAGELASVGTIATVTKHTDKATSYFLSWPYKYTYSGTSGDARVNITGGTIGFINGSDTTGGNIYGSARGTVGDRYVTGRLATARVTHVDINLTNPGDKIIGDVYGSGENGHVYDSAVVTLTNGLVLGNVFGGGKGVDTYTDQLKDPTDDHLYNAEVYDIIAGKVFGNTKVNILGGRVAKNVYGGGNLASVGIGNYKGYGEGTEVSSADSSLAEDWGHCYVTILGGIIGPDSLVNGTAYNGAYDVNTGNVYGAGKGIVFPAAKKVGFDYDRDYYVAYVNKTFVVIGDSNNRSCQYTSSDPHVTGIVFGGGENGHTRFDTYIQTNRGQIGVRPLDATGKLTSDVGHWNNRGNIFGAGRGEDKLPNGKYCQSAGSVTRNTRIDVLGARIYRNVQGGGAMASVGPIKGRGGETSTCFINVDLPSATDTLGGPSNTNNAFGGYIGGGSRGIPSPDGTRNDSLATCHNSQINIYKGWIKNTIYGGGENGQMLGNTQVNVYGNDKANVNNYVYDTLCYIRSAIYGGGKGSWMDTTIDASCRHCYDNDTLSGNVYGNTEVNLLGGKVPFTYGGCRRASVGGNATVNIGKDNGDGTYSGDASFIVGKDKVYGGNQYAGSPRGNIYVNVYKTAHTITDAATYTEDDGVNGAPTYAINYVYGGSYNSPYLPKDSGHFAQVHVYGCDNTINEVYGGCAAADAGAKPGIGANTRLIIDGGRFNAVFGGGDGTFDRYLGTAVPANIYGAAITEIHGGTIGSLFGGSNFKGQADTIRISVDTTGPCGTTVEGDEFFGGSNVANLDNVELYTTLGCGVNFRAAYGGSNQADITGNITLTIEGGEFDEVYGGSKGAIVAPSARQGQKDTAEANIAGNTHLIIKGGTIHSAFGGSNINGNITGTITVDIDSTYNNCDWNVDYVYGGSNFTQYLPDDTTVTNHSPSPQVNLLCGTVNNDVYGGGKGSSTDNTAGLVQSNPQVVMSQTAKGTTWVKGSIYGGGELATAEGTTSVTVTGGTVGQQSYYFGSALTTNPDADPDANVDYTTDVAEYYKDNAPANTALGHVYGGGKGLAGDNAFCDVNATNVIIGTASGAASDLRIYGSVYGGSAMGHVTGNTAVTVHSGTIGTVGVSSWDGNIFGGSEGSGYVEDENSNGEVDDDEVNFIIYPTSGRVGGNTSVTIDGGRIKGSVYGGGRLALTGVDATGDYSSFVTSSLYDSTLHGFSTVSVGGNAVIGMGANDNEAKTALASDFSVGDIFGSGRGDVAYYNDVLAGRVANTTVSVSGSPTVYGAVFGGGEMAGVGYWTDAEGHPFVAQTGTSHVSVAGGDFGTPYEYSAEYLTAAADNPDDWTVIDIYKEDTTDTTFKGRLFHACTGNIIGASQGDVDPEAPHWISMGRSRQSYVTISDGTIMGNVYGGAEQGVVLGNTKVTVSGGTIGTLIPAFTFKDSNDVDVVCAEHYFGSVYGGGYGREYTIPHDNDSNNAVATLIAGRVYGNTRVEISGNTIIRENVFGGGNMASVGYVKKENGSYVINDTSKHSGGICTVIIRNDTVNDVITSPTIGPDDGTMMNGHVYGAGKGVGYDKAEYFKELCNVERTFLTVSGGHIYGSTFGGGADCHVLGSTNTYIKPGAYIGSDGYTEEYDGCVWGGGRNALNINHTAGRVAGHTHVTVTGGRIQRTVQGGGALARTGVDVNGLVTAFVDENHVYDSTDHGSTFVNVSGLTDTILFSNYDPASTHRLYAGTVDTFTVAGVKKVVLYHTTIGAPDGPIIVDNDYTIGDIFGGGKGDTKDTVDIMAGKVMNTYVYVSGSPRIMADIYAGGEMSCVGWYNTTGDNIGVYYPRTGHTHVTIDGSPRTGTPYEFSCANIHYGRPWTLIDSLGWLYHTCSGNVYGGGQGYVEQDATNRHNWVQMGRVYRTNVTINGGRFMGNVFGGGSRGIVKDNCYVTINGGTFGTNIVDDTTINGKRYDLHYAYGSIFGGGYGNHKVFWHYNDSCFVNGDDTLQMQAPEFAGRVYGNTFLTITGGQIMANVYGGGDMASTGFVLRDPTSGEFMFYDSTARRNGICTVIIRNDTNKTTGAVRIPIIGPHDHTLMNGHVYGGGKGVPKDPKEIFKRYCNVNETNLTVSGGHIYGSTFGGGADCHVLGHTRTTIHRGAYIGSDEYTEEYDGCVFGGGRNAQNSNGTAGRVQGHTFITVDGGRIQRTILGGGALARTGVDTNGLVTAFVDANNVYDSVHHGSTNIKVSGTYTDVLASEMNSDYNKRFKGTTTTEGVEEGNVRLHHTTIGVYNGPLLVDNDYTIGDIFGGGKGDTKDTVDILAGKVMNTYVKVSGSPRIMADIYAGGEMSCVGWYNTTGDNIGVYYPGTGYTHVEITDDPRTGTPYEFSCANIHYGRPWTLIDSIGRLYHTCSGNVYGGGQGYVEEDGTHRWNWVQMGRVYQTEVKIHGGHFMGNVFGGGSRGIVKKDCHVTITGGTFGNHIVDDTTINGKIYNNRYNYGSIFGGGYGNHKTFWHYNDSCFVKPKAGGVGYDTILMQPLEFAGRVYGNTYVKITGGHIMDCVYGGGDMASTGWVERDADGKFQFNDRTKRHGGVCNVEISGNTIVGPLDYFGHNAYVYAAGRGVGYDPTEEFKTYCNVNEAHLTVNLTTSGNPATKPADWTPAMGGRIWGSLFGGGADSHVLDSVSVVLHSGLVGTQGTTSFDGNIFGGGRNYLKTNHTNGRVQGNIRVFVDGGTLQGTIFGGGRLALSGVDVDGHFIDSTHGNVNILVCGNATIGNSNADSLLKSNESCGDIFGSGKGDIKNYEDVWAGRVTNAKITVKDSLGHSPRIYGSIFGGGEMASLGYWDDTIKDAEGNVIFHTKDDVSGSYGTAYGTFYDGTGTAVVNISGNVLVGTAYEYTVNPADNPGDWTIYNETQDTLLHTCTGNVFGGSQGDVDPSAPRWVSMGRSASAVVNISGGRFMSNIFGGGEQGIVTGDTRVNISGGVFGIDALTGSDAVTANANLTKYYSGDIYAAGYGCDDPDEYNDVTPNDSTVGSTALSVGWNPGLLSGRTFGNSRVDITGGHIAGSVYGGGSFASVGDDKPGFTVNGNTTVNIGLPGADPDDKSQATGSATIDGEVFGANNFSGTPYGNTNVHIYKTAHTTTPTDNSCPASTGWKSIATPDEELTEADVEALPTAEGYFALKAVYGGGNHAAHTPLATDGTTNVYVHYCDENTIRDVYGGGNAADTKNNHIVIEGGRIYEVFGGGNGAGAGNPGANVSGTAHTEIRGGLITDVFGGSNALGNVGNIQLEIEKGDNNCDMMVANTFGGGNEAFGGGGVITLGCGTHIGSFYGGSRNADLRGDIVLNIHGGLYEKIFGGSKGQLAADEERDPETNEITKPAVAANAANIEGNITVNIYGGNIETLYGGSDQNGNITGTIQVNIDLDPDYNCSDGLRLDRIYGGGNLAIYTPTPSGEAPNQTYPSSPEINIINNVAMQAATGDDPTYEGFIVQDGNLVKFFNIQNIFGGGYGDGKPHPVNTPLLTGYVHANPVINVGGIDMKWNESTGTMGAMEADPYRRNIAFIAENIYGGGEAAPVDGNPRVTLYSSRTTGLDGSGEPIIAKKYHDTTVVHGSIFGGGHGQTAVVTGNTTVGIFGDATVVLGNVYGGGEASITNGSTDVMVGYDVIAMPIISIDDHGKVTITCATPGVTIYYTTNGDVPSNANGTKYTTSFTPDPGTTVRAIAYKYGYPPSLPTYPMHTFAPTITINSSHVATLKMPAEHADATIYYTLNGDTPTSASSHVASGGTVTVASGEVLKAIAIRPGYASSRVAMLTCATPVIEIDRTGKAKVTCATAGATIRYTLGVDPADPVAWTTATTVANGGTVTVSSGQTIKVMADRPGYQPSEVAVGVYSSVPAPTFTVDPVNFTVSITSATGDIHYTDNGDVPTAESDPYTAMLTDMAGKTVKAIAVVGTTVSSIAVLAPTATPTFQNTPYTDGDQVTITCSDAGATIYYSTDGGSTYTAGITGTSSSTFTATGGTTLKAYAYKQGMNVSAATEAVNVSLCSLSDKAPTITVTGTRFTIALADGTPAGAVIHYTTDGNDPTASSPTYSSAVDLPSGSTTIKAITTRTGCSNSPVTTVSYCRLADPEMSINGSGQVTITPVEGVAFHYTTDGSTPTASTPTTYSEPFTVDEFTTVKAIAVKDGCNVSNVVSESYCGSGITISSIDVDFSGGTFVITCSPSDATIYFEIHYDEDQVTDPDPRYSSSCTSGQVLRLDDNCDYCSSYSTAAIRAIAVKNGCVSDVENNND